jgi:hypothetical protein
MQLAQKEYKNIIAIIPGHNAVFFSEKGALDILLTN